MIPRSRGVATVALVLAAATHVLALHDFSGGEDALVQGGGSGEVAALGDAFKDYVTGATASSPATAHQPTVTPAQQNAVSPTSQAPAAVAQAITHTVPNNTAVVAVTHQKTPVEAQKAEPVKTPSKTEAVAEPPTPKQAEPTTQKVDQVASQAGNSEKSAKKGSATGKTSKGAATAKKATSAAVGQGNAEATNYRGHVMRKITRARRKSVNVRGAVLVSFRIGDNGALVSINISRSSGSKRLDQVALAQVRAAAPFQPPPASARRDYTIEIVGK